MMTIDEASVVRVAVTELPTPPKTPFLSDSSKVISILAFVVSVVTTVYTSYRAYEQDKEATKKEISQLIDDAAKVEKIIIGQKGKILSASDAIQSAKLKSDVYISFKKAYEIRKSIDTPVWMSIGAFIAGFSDFSKATKAFEQAAENADSPLDKANAYRGEAHMAVLSGNIDKAQDLFKKATNVFDEKQFKDTDMQDFLIDLEESETQILWLELIPPEGDCNYLNGHVTSANEYIDNALKDVSEKGPIMGLIQSKRDRIKVFQSDIDECAKKSQSPPQPTSK